MNKVHLMIKTKDNWEHYYHDKHSTSYHSAWLSMETSQFEHSDWSIVDAVTGDVYYQDKHPNIIIREGGDLKRLGTPKELKW
jgi:hypothetical protein